MGMASPVPSEAGSVRKPKNYGLKWSNYMEDALCEAAAKGNLNKIRRMLMERVEINYIDGFGWAPLHYAARNGQFEAVKILLNNWANPDVENAAKVTPLFLAAKGNHVNCVKLLLLMGANPNKQCHTGCTPREFAPNKSETQKVIEQCLEGYLPEAAELFHTNDPPIVPSFSIPVVEKPKREQKKGRK